jgi:hypothetical protein
MPALALVVVVDYIHAILQLLLLTFLLLLLLPLWGVPERLLLQQQQPILILYCSILRHCSCPRVVMVLELATPTATCSSEAEAAAHC